MSYQNSPQGKDPELWLQARKRVEFKRHLSTYFVVNAMLWLIWAFTGSHVYHSGFPWPLWPSLGWGIGLAFHYIGTYIQSDSVEKEYEKLSQNKNKS
jgi:hypothetical protein